jgi:uncharacterized SAM-binding protein YcdF (DUF218 family)
MFFIVSKILYFIISPIVWVFSLLLLAIFKKRFRNKMLLIATCLLYLFSNSFLLEEVNRWWEIPATRYQDLKQYDAGIVLGGMLDYDMDYHRIQFQRSADRLFQAIELYKRGDIKKIFYVGGSGSIEFAAMKEGMFVRRYLLTLGIPDKDIWIENESRNTRENAFNAVEILKQKHAIDGSYLLITSAMHMRRSMGCFKALHLRVAPYSVDRNASPERRYTMDHLLLPNPATLIFWKALIHEWVGIMVYKRMGYM